MHNGTRSSDDADRDKTGEQSIRSPRLHDDDISS